MDSADKTSFVFWGDKHVDIEARRDESAESWRLTVTVQGKKEPILSGAFPANFDTDRRTAREFSRDLVALLWPSSHAADIARKHARAAKRNRHKVM